MKNISITLFSILCFAIMGCSATKYPNLEKGMYAEINTTKGNILLKLHFEETPLTVANFVSLVEGKNSNVSEEYKNKPFYNGLKFHRVIPNFMVQGGDPLGTGSGSPGYKFPDEFPKDKDGNLLFKHSKPGILSMANAGPGTNGSQFFITHKETPWLDGKHTIFGEIVTGQSVIDSIAKDDIIEKVNIIRVGKEAKKFKAAAVFEKKLKAITEANAKAEKEQMEAFVKKVNQDKATLLTSGVGLLITEKGTGSKVQEEKPVTLHYSGYLANGTLFDSSLKRGQPLKIPALKRGQMIPGFVDGLIELKVGDKATIFIPSELGYGAQGRAPIIPANSDLVFEVEILNTEG